MMLLRNHKPKRTCKRTYSNYRSYKAALRKDFGKECGYCADSDLYSGGGNFYHIDHFKPLKHYNTLKCEYSNLIYACAFCNIAKSDDWPCLGTDLSHSGGKGYVDPCDATYEDHFERMDDGRISPKTNVGKYMFEQLKLGLRRHELIYLVSLLYKQLTEVSDLYQLHRHTPKADALAKALSDLFAEYQKYKGFYEETL